jgi:hypothetical protein
MSELWSVGYLADCIRRWNMLSESPSDREFKGLELQFDALLAEYRILQDQIARFRQMQSQLDGLALTALGLSVPLILVILERNIEAVGAILLIPILFFAIAFAQLRHERQISLDAIYADSGIRAKASEVLSLILADKKPIFERERFLSQHYFPSSFLMQWVITTSRGGISIGMGIGLIAVCLYVQLVLLELEWNPYETLLLVIASVVLIADLVLGFSIARLHYSFYTTQRDSLRET